MVKLLKQDMKIILLFMSIIFFGCQTNRNKDSEEFTQEIVKQKILSESYIFNIGDINKDKINDTAFISFDRNNVTNDILNSKENNVVTIKFSENIPEIIIERSLGIYIKKMEDINDDLANEIIIFSRTHQGWWNSISVWTFKNNEWEQIAQTKGFVLENEYFENRITKEQNKYYLIGEDMWNEDEKGNFEKTKVEIKIE